MYQPETNQKIFNEERHQTYKYKKKVKRYLRNGNSKGTRKKQIKGYLMKGDTKRTNHKTNQKIFKEGRLKYTKTK